MRKVINDELVILLIPGNVRDEISKIHHECQIFCFCLIIFFSPSKIQYHGEPLW